MSRVLVTGANGMLGKSICNKFKSEGFEVIETTRDNVDLRNFQETFGYLSKQKFELLIHCAATVGGIKANINGNTKFFLDNISIDYSVLSAARSLKIQNLVYIGSSCMYPANTPHRLKENEILNGPLESTNEGYALAKIFGSRMTSSIALEDDVNWRIFVASNLYGDNDHFNDDTSHLLAAIISKAFAAKAKNEKTIEMWGDGTPRREFTFVDDFAEWIFKSSNFLESLPYILNVGIGEDHSVLELYEKVLKNLNLDITIVPNLSISNGVASKLMDSNLARSFGWNPKVFIDEGIDKTVKWYSQNQLTN